MSPRRGRRSIAIKRRGSRLPELQILNMVMRSCAWFQDILLRGSIFEGNPSCAIFFHYCSTQSDALHVTTILRTHTWTRVRDVGGGGGGNVELDSGVELSVPTRAERLLRETSDKARCSVVWWTRG